MSTTLRILCVVGAAVTFVMMTRRVKKAQIRIDDSIFWVLFSFSLVIIALFPQIPQALAHLFGFQATSNFVFLAVIMLLLLREFLNTMRISKLDARLNQLVQEQALQSIDEDTHEQPEHHA